MTKLQLDLALLDSELARVIPQEWLAGIRFTQSNKPSHTGLVRLCKSKSHYYDEELIGKKWVHFAGFAKTIEQAKLLNQVLEEMRVDGIKCAVYIDGTIVPRLNALRNMLDCFSHALECKDYRTHCEWLMHDPHDRKRTESEGPDGLPLKPLETWVIPCSHIRHDLDFEHSSGDPHDILMNTARRAVVHKCPFFDANRMGEVVLVPRSRKFWK